MMRKQHKSASIMKMNSDSLRKNKSAIEFRGIKDEEAKLRKDHSQIEDFKYQALLDTGSQGSQESINVFATEKEAGLDC